MKNNKLIEILSLGVFLIISLEFIIFPGLASDDFTINVISLTGFFLLVAFVFFGGIASGINKDSDE